MSGLPATNISRPQATHPYRHNLDEVTLSYDGASRKYRIVFRKIIENLDEQPLENFYARIMVCAFPWDVSLAAHYYQRHPISLEELAFRAWDSDGKDLRTTILHQEPSTIELLIWFQDKASGRPFALRRGERREVFYEIQPRDSLWGPFLLRHVRWYCDEMYIKLRFPKELVHIWGQMMGVSTWPSVDVPLGRKVGANQLWESIKPIPERHTRSGQEEFIWRKVTPEVGSLFRFAWEFIDRRDRLLSKTFGEGLPEDFQPPQKEIPGSAASKAREYITLGLIFPEKDFRSVYWFGTWYQFTAAQARCIEILWRVWLSGSPGISGDAILEEAECTSSKLSAIFRRSLAWEDNIIFSPRKGIYTLRPPITLENLGKVTPIRRP